MRIEERGLGERERIREREEKEVNYCAIVVCMLSLNVVITSRYYAGGPVVEDSYVGNPFSVREGTEH
jgi:hypothetical protein